MTPGPRHPPNPGITSYRDLIVWQKAVDQCVEVYRLCKTLPRHETFVLGAQLRRASVSVACNIAEGHARSHTGEFLQQLSVARGSLAEMETQLIIGTRVEYFTEGDIQPLLTTSDGISRMLWGLTTQLKRRQASTRRTRSSRQ